jgi:hypothetical protein
MGLDMAITVNCTCGKQLQARDEYAGKRLKCPGCGATIAVPAGRPDDAAELPDTVAVITFSCQCGKTYQVEAKLAGRKSKCTACGAALVIPQATAKSASTAVKELPATVRLATAKKPSAPDLSDAEEMPVAELDENEASGTGDRKKGNALLVAGIGVLVLALVGATIAYFAWPKGDDKKMPDGGALNVGPRGPGNLRAPALSMQAQVDGDAPVAFGRIDMPVTRASGVGGPPGQAPGTPPGTPNPREAAARAQSQNNLKQLALAFLMFADQQRGTMPAAAIVDKSGKPLLSWRVAILPYIKQAELYKQFKLDEPWDSEHNRKLLPRMPKVYGHPLMKPIEPNSSHYQVFTGKDTPFNGVMAARFPASFTDGTSNTLLVVEAAESVPWTKPADLAYDAAKPLPKLGTCWAGGGFLAALADGSVRMVGPTVKEATLRAAITPSGGEILGPDWNEAPPPPARGSALEDAGPASGQAIRLIPGDPRSALGMIPADGLGFLSVRVADWWTSPFGKKMQQEIAKISPEALKEIDKHLGVSPADIDRVVVVVAGPQPDLIWAIVATNKAYDPTKVLAAIDPKARVKKYKEKLIFVSSKDNSLAIHFVNDRLAVVGSPESLPRFFDRSPSGAAGPLSEAIKLAEGKHQVVGGFQLPADLAAMAKANVPPDAKPFEPLLDLQTATLTASLGDDLDLTAKLNFPSDGAAKKAHESIKGALVMASMAWPEMKKQIPKEGPEAALIEKAIAPIDAFLKNPPIEQQGKTVSMVVKTEGGATTLLTGLLLPAIQKMREAAARAQSSNNLRQIALAFHNYHDTYGHMPAAAIVDKSGKPLLSWRVAILPFIEHDQLYKQFHLDEPWDSEHNKKLLDKMPKTYAHPIGQPKEPNSTYYRVFTGKDTPFNGSVGPRLPATFQDGTSNTILVVEAGEAVPWTKPDDLPYDAAKPVPPLGKFWGGGFLAALADGSVRTISKSITERTLRAAITPAGGEVLGSDW